MVTKFKQICIAHLFRDLIANIYIKNARKHNLKGIDVRISLNALTVITGVSGSGKLTLIKNVFEPAMKERLTIGQNGGNTLSRCCQID